LLHPTETDYIQLPTRLEMEKHRTLDEGMAYVNIFHMLSELLNQGITKLRAGLIQHTKCQR
jgi:hypothetical protein